MRRGTLKEVTLRAVKLCNGQKLKIGRREQVDWENLKVDWGFTKWAWW